MSSGAKVETWWCKIYIAGSRSEAIRACSEYCMKGLCVTVTPTTYVYTGGVEDGVEVGLINYPRFPCTQQELEDEALRLADRLRQRLYQHSYTVMTPARTIWHSHRTDGPQVSTDRQA